LGWLDGSSVAIPLSLFAEQMMEAVNNKQYSDVTFTVKQSNDSNAMTTVYGHKCVLVSRSDYFKTILDPNSAFSERGRNSFPLDEIHLVSLFLWKGKKNTRVWRN